VKKDTPEAKRETTGGTMSKETNVSKETDTDFGNDKRRRHQHWLVTIVYTDKQEFSRVYLDIEKAKKFAKRQKKSPVVRGARIKLLR